MPYAHRDSNGQILALYQTPQAGAEEYVDASSTEVLNFINPQAASGSSHWVTSDLSLVRVLEDLIEVMIDKALIAFNELPPSSQQKMLERRSQRSDPSYVEQLVNSAAAAGFAVGDEAATDLLADEDEAPLVSEDGRPIF